MRRIAFIFTIALAPACDADIQVGDVIETFNLPPADCGKPGKTYGPCADESCGADLYCLETVDGNMCVPYAVNGHPAKSAASCKTKYGNGFQCVSGVCLHLCSVDTDCLGGTICSEIPGVCVWSYTPAGSTGEVEMTSSPSTGTTEAPDPSTGTTGTTQVSEPSTGVSTGTTG